MQKETRYFSRAVGFALVAALLGGCATNGGSQLPSTTVAPLNSNVLQLAVGTATSAQDDAVGLNVVATLRQPNGLSGVLADQPKLTLPAGMLVPAGTPGAYTGTVSNAANVDAGTNTISGSPQVPRNNAGLVNSTLGTFTGVFSNGFGPFNCDQGCSSTGAYYIGNPNASIGNGFDYSIYDGADCPPGSSPVCSSFNPTGDPTQPLPFFSADPFDYVVGPPAVPFFANGKQYAGFAGYSPGFTVFELAPAAGAYGLSVLVPATNVAPVTYTASANLASTTPLGTIAATFAGDGNGGATGTVTVPAGVTEAEVFVVDATTNEYFTAALTGITGPGAVPYSIAGNLGSCGTNCPQPTFTAGDKVYYTVVGYDYPAIEASSPGNTSAKPAIANANGQADLTMGVITNTTY